MTTDEIYYGYEMDSASNSNQKARELVDKGWHATYAALFGQSFVDVLAKHHIEAIEWHWYSRLAILRGEKPKYYADFEKWARGHMKSTCARRIAVIDAFMSYAFGVGGYCLYFSGTDNKTDLHAVSINQLLQSKAMQQYAPALSRVKKSEEGGRSLGWKATFYYTDAGYIFHFGSLQSGLAGGNVGDLRPTLLVPDDIDDRKDSPAIAEKNARAFTTEILPMGKTGTLTLFAQNLINRLSVMYRIHKGQLKVLTNRRPSEPIPAVENLEIEYRTVGGIVTPFIASGHATWEKGMPIDACEEELQRIGEGAFRSECQHEVEQSKEGLMHKKYDDTVHPISYSQFASRYGSPNAWKQWYKVPFSDWARTKTKFHANVAGFLAVSSQNTVLPGLTFCLPMSFKADTTPTDVAERLLSSLTLYAAPNITWKDLIDEAWKRTNSEKHFDSESERIEYTKSYYKRLIPKYSVEILRKYNVKTGANSHSEDKVREMFNECFGFSFIASNPGETDALEDIDEAMRVDYTMPHLFDSAKTGYTRWYVLCPDDMTQEPQITNGVKVYPPISYPEAITPDELHDSDLFRYQMSNRRYAPPKTTELGERIDRALKLDDDFGQALQMCYFKQLLSNIELTSDEKVELTLPNYLRKETLETLDDATRAGRQVMRDVKLKFENPLKQGKLDNKTGKFWGEKFLK